jgi:hypothetical protein
MYNTTFVQLPVRLGFGTVNPHLKSSKEIDFSSSLFDGERFGDGVTSWDEFEMVSHFSLWKITIQFSPIIVLTNLLTGVKLDGRG